MTPKQRELLELTIASLREHPEEWTRDTYRTRHRSGALSVWIANAHFGLEIEGAPFQTLVGGFFFGGSLIPWRRRLRAAAMGIESPAEAAAKEAVRQAEQSAADALPRAPEAA